MSIQPQRRKMPPAKKEKDEASIAAHIIELEANVLGGVIKERDALTAVIDILKPDSFSIDRHRALYQAILQLFGKTAPIDLLTVIDQLRKNGELEFVGGAAYVTKITSSSTVANIEENARIVVQYAIRRRVLGVLEEVLDKAYEDTADVYDLMDFTEQELREIQEGTLNKNIPELSSVVQKAIQELKNKSDNSAEHTSVPSGMPTLDRLTSGFHNTELIIVAARPGMGKTAFVVSAMRNAAIDFKLPVALFSLEMSSQQVMLRLISAEAEIDSEKLRKGELNENEWLALHSRLNNLSTAPIYIDDTPALSILELRTKARRLKHFHDIKLIIVDYLQLMTAGKTKQNMNREQEIAAISRSLKTLAKELNVPVISLSQLSRSVETRSSDNKRPQLSDLRESGSIEQDADVVMFIYRPEYYGYETNEKGESTKGYAEIILSKNRSGSLGTAELQFIGKYTKFGERTGYKATSEDYKDIGGIASKANAL